MSSTRSQVRLRDRRTGRRPTSSSSPSRSNVARPDATLQRSVVTDAPDPAPAADPETVPHCYRHPDRETYVRCVRCDRPICPDCMRSASVGFQCPDCVRGGARTVRKPRTAFGGLVPSGIGQVTRILIGLNVVVYVIQQVSDDFTSKYALLPAKVVLANGDTIGV